jgi:CDP-diacylglycerol---serine O-phosphatidyltransferase
MKHLPNLLTLANLFCGCLAITFILSAQNFNTAYNLNEYIEVPAVEQPYLGSLFIFLAALFDMLDGFAARGLKVFSPIGKDLDSLADIVSFGVAPSMILFKLLWLGFMRQPEAMDISIMAMSPAFLVACFGALRLAKFNITASEQSHFFKGLPIPAVGLIIATFPLILWKDSFGLSRFLLNPYIIYLVIAVLSWLMVSKIRFFKFMPSSWSLQNSWPQLLLIVVTAACIPVLKFAALTVGMLLYIILSFVNKPKQI